MIELVVAFYVLITLMLPCCALMIGGRALSRQSQIQAAAYQAARQELETLRSYKFNNRLATTSTTFTIPASITAQFPQAQLKGVYSISSFGALTNPPMQQIIVKVSWVRNQPFSGNTSYVRYDALVVQEPGH